MDLKETAEILRKTTIGAGNLTNILPRSDESPDDRKNAGVYSGAYKLSQTGILAIVRELFNDRSIHIHDIGGWD